MGLIVCIIKVYILGASIVIAFDDNDARKSIKAIMHNLEKKIKLRNDVLEALLVTKGHQNSSILWKRYIPIFLSSCIIVCIETCIGIEYVSIVLSIIAIAITIVLKHICNEAYERLKRDIKNNKYS